MKIKRKKYYKYLPIYNFKKYSFYEVCEVPIKNGMILMGAGKDGLCTYITILVKGTSQEMNKTITDWELMMIEGKTVPKRRPTGALVFPSLRKDEYISTKEELKKRIK